MNGRCLALRWLLYLCILSQARDRKGAVLHWWTTCIILTTNVSVYWSLLYISFHRTPHKRPSISQILKDPSDYKWFFGWILKTSMNRKPGRFSCELWKSICLFLRLLSPSFVFSAQDWMCKAWVALKKEGIIMIPGPLEINPAWCPKHCFGAPEAKLRNLALSHLSKGETIFGLDHYFGTIPIGIGKQQTYPSLTLFVNLLFLLLEEMFLFCWGATRRIYRLPPAHLQCKGGSKVEDHVEWFRQHFGNSQTRIWSPLCGDHCINSTGKLDANSEFRLFWLLLVGLWCRLRK